MTVYNNQYYISKYFWNPNTQDIVIIMPCYGVGNLTD